MEGWMIVWVGASNRSLRAGGGGGGQVAMVGGAPVKIPIDWLINLEEKREGRKISSELCFFFILQT